MNTLAEPKLKRCPHCAEEILEEAKKCKHCGEYLDGHPQCAEPSSQSWSPGVAAVLSFFFPGVGQIYKGDIAVGIVLLIFTIIGYMFFIIPGMILHFYAVYSAFSASPPKRKAATP